MTIIENKIIQLQQLLNTHQDKRVTVIGTSCIGKSTLLKSIINAQDMDRLLFPSLSREEVEYLSQSPWTPEIGATMTRLANERITVQPGKPVFGTVILVSDLIIQLSLSEELLRDRAEKRGALFSDVQNMHRYIQAELSRIEIPTIAFDLS